MKYYTIKDGDGIRDISQDEYDLKLKKNEFFSVLGQYEFTLLDLNYEEIC